MAKIKTTQNTPKTQRNQGFWLNDNFKFFDDSNKNSLWIFLGIIFLVLILFFNQGIFSGKVFSSPDNLSPLSHKTFLEDSKSQGIFPLWTPYIFMGMPSYASLTTGLQSGHKIFSFVWNSVIEFISKGNLFWVTLPYYFIFAVGLFFYGRFKFKNGLIALFIALTGVFATGIIQLIIVGHHTKMMVFSFFPFILLFLDMLSDSEEKNPFKQIIYFALLSIALYMQLSFNHIQMLFYSYMFIAFYFAFVFVYRLVKKLEIKNLILTAVLFVAALIAAFAMSADPILPIKEYNKYSIRGEASIESKIDPSKEDAKPLSYDYATNWSFSPGEMMTMVIPYYYGFGNVEVEGQQANLYWGQMPFTDSPVYFGVITLVLALIGVIFNIRKNVFVMALSFIIFFFMLLSFGRTFPVLYDIFYNYMPFFSSFRAPVMIHYYIDLAFTLLAGFGLKSIIDSIKEGKNRDLAVKVSYVFMGIGILVILIAVIGFEHSYSTSVSTGPLVEKIKSQGATPQQINQYVKQISSLAYKNVVKDMFLHGFFIVIIAGAVFAYAKNKISLKIFLLAAVLLGTFDVLNISSKTMHWDDKGAKETYFNETDQTKWLLSKEPDTYQYRVAEFNRGKLSTSNLLAYFRLHLFNGYQGAKLRIYQDAVDVAGGENPMLLGLANVKYIISDSPIKDTVAYTEVYKSGSGIIYQNKFFMPRAFFVNEVKTEKPINILRNIQQGKINPYLTAYTESQIPGNIQPPDSTCYAKITKFSIQQIEYDVNASGNNFLALNEMYYPKDWKCYIDGNETEIFKTNYIQRGIIVPKGKHKVEMKYESDTYNTSKNISFAANLIILAVLGAGIGGYYFKKNKNDTKK